MVTVFFIPIHSDLIPYICYDLTIITSTLTPSFYSTFQTQLLEKILKYRKQNVTFKEIADKLNEERQLSTQRRRPSQRVTYGAHSLQPCGLRPACLLSYA
jgi:hypothetical protein